MGQGPALVLSFPCGIYRGSFLQVESQGLLERDVENSCLTQDALCDSSMGQLLGHIR